jgi:hypothetical protein
MNLLVREQEPGARTSTNQRFGILASGRFLYQVARKAISATFIAFLEQLLAAYPAAPVGGGGLRQCHHPPLRARFSHLPQAEQYEKLELVTPDNAPRDLLRVSNPLWLFPLARAFAGLGFLS